MKALALLIFITTAVVTSHALSCACGITASNLSNALYTKEYALKVRIAKMIAPPTPAPTPAPTPSPNVDSPVPLQIDFIPFYYGWEPNYYLARVKTIFKQPKTPDDNGNDVLQLEEDEWIVVQAGVCSPHPDEMTPYLIMASSLFVMDVPGHGKAKVLSMPGYCEFYSKWDDVDKDRRAQLRRYASKGETPCFTSDCDWENVPIRHFIVPCADGTLIESQEVCEYNEDSHMCEKDFVIATCNDGPVKDLPMPDSP